MESVIYCGPSLPLPAVCGIEVRPPATWSTNVRGPMSYPVILVVRHCHIRHFPRPSGIIDCFFRALLYSWPFVLVHCLVFFSKYVTTGDRNKYKY